MVTLINLPQPNSLDDHLDPPLGILYIAGYLRARDITVRIVDLSLVPMEKWRESIGKAEWYGITIYSASLHIAKDVARICKENSPNCKVVVGGPHVSTLPWDTLQNKDFDIAVKREGESTFYEIIKDNLEKGVYDGPLCEPLDDLPYPARDLVDLHLYTRKIFGRKATSVTTSRGCPFECVFCCKDVFGSKVRYFTIDRVVSEIKSIIDNFGIYAFLFMDDTFVMNRKRLYPMLKEIEKLGIVFSCNGDARNNNLEDYKRLYKAGCRSIAFGIESGSQKILDTINKGVTVEQNKKALQDARKAGLIAKAYLMVGAPGEDKQSIEDTKQFIRESDPDQFTLFTFVPLPGCAVWRDPERFGVKITSKDFKEYYNIAGDNEGGNVTDTNIKELREDLLGFLRERGQRGPIQDYYKKVEMSYV